MGSFALQIESFVQEYKDRADDVVGLLVAKVAAEIDQRSPVGDGKYWISKPPKGYVGGHFRANWQLTTGAPATGVKPGTTGGLGGVMAVGFVLPENPAGNIFWLVNNVPYAQRIEHGWSRQAPEGVVGLTVLRWQKFVDEAVADARAGK